MFAAGHNRLTIVFAASIMADFAEPEEISQPFQVPLRGDRCV
jgi:hypothetical protein